MSPDEDLAALAELQLLSINDVAVALAISPVDVEALHAHDILALDYVGRGLR